MRNKQRKKREREICQCWENSGFLYGLEGKDKIILSMIFDKLAKHLLESGQSEVDVFAFPIVRRVYATCGFKELNVKHFYDFLKNVYANDYVRVCYFLNEKSKTKIDEEAVFCAFFCELYVSVFNEKSRTVLTEKNDCHLRSYCRNNFA